MSRTWEATVADKRSRLEKTIPLEWKIDTHATEGSQSSALDIINKSDLLSASELEIVNSTAVGLTGKLSNGQLKSVDVTLAFCKRAALAHQLVRAFQHSPFSQSDHSAKTHTGELRPRVLS